jgi:biotin transport system substrate-specific component
MIEKTFPTLARSREALPRLAMQALPVVAIVGLMVAAAQLRAPLPWTPVPVTFQTFVVLLGGALLGARRGAVAQGLYVGLAASGLPVLAGSAIGLAALLGPTGGYLIGFVLAAALVGRLLGGRRATWTRTLAVMALGEIVILLAGATQLVALGFTPRQAFLAGIAPFVLWDAVKILLAASIYRARFSLSRG